MARRRLSINEAEKFGSTGGSSYFKLVNDGDIAIVRFLYNDKNGEDLDFFLVHRIEVNGIKKYVLCNALTDEGTLNVDNCPLCQGKYSRLEKLFIQLYNTTTGKYEIWERSGGFISKLTSLMRRVGGDLSAQNVEIERLGKKGDTATTYDLYQHQADGKTLADFEPRKDLVDSNFILELSYEEMEQVLDGAYVLPSMGGNTNNESSRQSSSRGGSTTSRQSTRTRDREFSPRDVRNRAADDEF